MEDMIGILLGIIIVELSIICIQLRRKLNAFTQPLEMITDNKTKSAPAKVKEVDAGLRVDLEVKFIHELYEMFHNKIFKAKDIVAYIRRNKSCDLVSITNQMLPDCNFKSQTFGQLLRNMKNRKFNGLKLILAKDVEDGTVRLWQIVKE